MKDGLSKTSAYLIHTENTSWFLLCPRVRESVLSESKKSTLGLSAALTTATLSIPGNIAFGYWALMPLGPQWANRGALAGVFCSLFGAAIANILGTNPGLISGPKAPTTLVFATVLIQAANWLAPESAPAEHAHILISLGLATVCLSGLIQILLGTLKLGRIIQSMPHPVVSGFVNATAFILVASQWSVLIGSSLGNSSVVSENAWHPWNAAVALLTIAATLGARHFKTRISPLLIGLLAGSLAHHGFAQLAPTGSLGVTLPTIEMSSYSGIELAGITGLWGRDDLGGLVVIILTSAITMAILNSVDTLLTSLALEHLNKQNTKGDRELIVQGTANMLTGALGTLSCAGMVARTTIHYRSGGRTRISVILACVFTPMLVLLAAPILALVPKAAVSGLLAAIGILLVDSWSLGLLTDFFKGRYQGNKSLAVILLMVLAGVFFSIIAAVILGLILSVYFFLQSLSLNLFHRIQKGSRVRSRLHRSPQSSSILEKEGDKILILELAGPLFFGSAQTLKESIEQGVAAESPWVIIDFSRVHAIDSTASRILVHLFEQSSKKGRSLLFCGIHGRTDESSSESLTYQFPKIPEAHVFADQDRALEHAEDELLKGLGQLEDGAEFTIEELEFFQSLSPQAMEKLKPHFKPAHYQANDRIIEQGESGHRLFVLAKGRVDVVVDAEDSDFTIRVYSMSAGVFFGEMALFADTVRSAHVYARDAVTCLEVSQESFNQLSQEDPALALSLTQYITGALAARLRNANKLLTD